VKEDRGLAAGGTAGLAFESGLAMMAVCSWNDVERPLGEKVSKSLFECCWKNRKHTVEKLPTYRIPSVNIAGVPAH